MTFNDEHDVQRPPSTGNPTGRRQRHVYRRVGPESFDMAEAIKLWETLTGRRFEGNPATGLPWGMTQQKADADEDGEDIAEGVDA